MADISKVTLPNNETYDLKDSVARGGIGNAKLFYGTCSSAAAATEKAVTCSEFTAGDLVAGTMINVKFDATNSGAVASLTLNVNGTGAKSIKYIYNDSRNNIPGASYLSANNMYTFRYDGTYWVVQLMYNTNSNYDLRDYYFRPYAGSTIYRYKLCLLGEDNRLYPIVTTNQTSTTQVAKAVQTVGLKPENIWQYYSTTTTNAGAVVPGQVLYQWSYSYLCEYNFNATIPTYTTVYLRGTYNKDKDLFYLYDDGASATTSYYTTVPTNTANITLSNYFVSGYYYMLVGGSYSSANIMSLFGNHPLYYFDGTNLIPVETKVAKDLVDNAPYVPTTRKINNKVLSSDITLTASDVGALPSSTSIPIATTTTPKMNGTAAVGSETKWAKGDHVHPSDTSKVNKSGDTMTGLLKLNPSQYTDSHTVGALDLQNSNIIGTNGIYFADSSDGAGEAINFYRDTTHADSIHAYNGTLYFTPNRELGTGGTPKRVIVDGSTFPEAYLSWGGRNFSASYGPIDAAMVSELGANRFAFLKADGITVEYTRDNGETWIDYGLTDAQKVNIFSTSFPCVVGKSTNTDANRANANCQLRITVNTNLAKCYTVLNKFIFYVSTTGSGGSWASLDVARHSDPNTWINKFNKVGIGGWSGYNVINTSEITTYGNSDSQYQYLRFTFGIETQSSSYAGLSVSKIMAYGGVGWTTASNMATHGHLYSFDSSQNATFPAKVTATEFSGAVATSNISDRINQTIKGGDLGWTSSTDGDKVVTLNTLAYWGGQYKSGSSNLEYCSKGQFGNLAVKDSLTALEVGAVPTTRKVNNKELSADVTLTASDVGLGNVGNFKAVSTVASQGLTSTEQSNARANIGAGTSSLAIGTTSSTAAAGNHTHGNITNAGALQTTDVAIANGDKLVVTDSSNSSKIARTSVSFDGSTTTKALTPKGTFETFLQSHQSLAGYVPTSRTINSKALTSDITLTASDVGALPADQILTVDQGGIGLSSVTPGNYIKANSSHTFGQLTPAQVLADIGAATSGHTHTTTIASGGTSQINLAANTAYTLTAGGTSYVFKTPADSDTKNTTGSTDTSSEIYLVGATSQAANPQTYSHDTARVRANGRIVGSGYEFAVASAMGTTKATMVYDSTLEAIAFQFD